MKKLILFILGLVCTFAGLYAQSPQSIKPLMIGDSIPDVSFTEVMNYLAKTAKLSDFKDKKLVILDFWSTSCSACIGFFPHMQSLEKEFKDDLQIILVDGHTRVWHDNQMKIERVLKNLKRRSGVTIQLPIVLNCDILDQYFPRRTIPHEVWINGDGVIIAITGAGEVNAKNIRDILDGRKISMRMKKDVFFDIGHHPLSELVYGTSSPSGKPVSSSILFKGLIDGLGGGMGIRNGTGYADTLYTGWYVTNQPLLTIYKLAYGIDYTSNRILIETEDSMAFKRVSYSDTSKYNAIYSYDMSVPATTKKRLKEAVQRNLKSMLGTRVSYQKRKIPCFVLKSTPRSIKSIAKGGTLKYVMRKIDSAKYIRDFPISELVHELNLRYFKIPLIDETGIKANVNINMPDNLTQNNIIRALQKAGFEVKETKRMLDVAIICDN